jgi:hypothetical protein
MKFALVTSLITLCLVSFVSLVATVILSFFHADVAPAKKMPDLKIEIRWGEGS